ncbi:hypothetical protein [Dinoroseobacter sp. S375]|uniref:hypothetical protein n=1 Tax=Dinoroseobacter sp. S375 TaxID=3415136 RepID=UPI003C7C5A13
MTLMFEVSGIVDTIGHRTHPCIGQDVKCPGSARQKFERAYPGKAVTNVTVRRLEHQRATPDPHADGSLEGRVLAVLAPGVTLRSAAIAKLLGEEGRSVPNTLRRLKGKGLVHCQQVDSAGGHWGRV